MIRTLLIIGLLAFIGVREYQYQNSRDKAILTSECPDYDGRKIQAQIVSPAAGTLTCTYMDINVRQVK